MTKMSALGDLTGDGHVDLITVDSSGVSRIYAGAGAGAGVGRFGAPLVFGPGWDNFVSMSALGDETNDTPHRHLGGGQARRRLDRQERARRGQGDLGDGVARVGHRVGLQRLSLTGW